MESNIERGQEFMKQITKAALSALFAIGVTSSQNIDKFIEHFSEELMKNYPDNPTVKIDEEILVVPSQPQTEPITQNPSPSKGSETVQKGEADVSVIVKDAEILKILRASGIDTINQLILEGQKRSLTEINGIEPRVEDEIRESLKEYNK